MNNLSNLIKKSIYFIKCSVQVVAGVTLFKEKVGDLRWCEGASMLPTLNVTGDLLLQIPISSIFNKNLKNLKINQDQNYNQLEIINQMNLNRGDLINFISPLNPSILACKRILALPGDQILIDQDFFNHHHHHTSSSFNSIKNQIQNQIQLVSKSFIIIPEGHVWLEGDNSSVSIDSRTYGPVPIRLISGKIIARVWPNFNWLSKPFKKS